MPNVAPSKNKNSNSNEIKAKRDLSPISKRKVDNLKRIMTLPHKVDSPMQTKDKYSIESLFKDWNLRNTSQFPDHWGEHNTDAGLLFVYVGDMDGIASRSILVKTDMSVKVSYLIF